MSRVLLLLCTLALPALADEGRGEPGPAVRQAREGGEDVPQQPRCEGALSTLESRSAPLGEPWDEEAETLVALEATCEEALRVGRVR